VALLSTVGVLVGAASAFWGGGADQAIMRVVDLMLSVPQFFLLLMIVALVGPSTVATVLVIGLTSWMGMARLVRGQVLSLKNQDFVLAARAIGSGGWRLLLRHLLPNCLGIIIVNATLWVAIAIVLESSLSYLGLGAQPPTPTWGNMLTEGRRYMREAWWIIAFPGLAIFVTAMSFNLMGDGLRDALDPRSSSGRV
jgi:peptide/nickel transport system permease protein